MMRDDHSTDLQIYRDRIDSTGDENVSSRWTDRPCRAPVHSATVGDSVKACQCLMNRDCMMFMHSFVSLMSDGDFACWLSPSISDMAALYRQVH